MPKNQTCVTRRSDSVLFGFSKPLLVFGTHTLSLFVLLRCAYGMREVRVVFDWRMDKCLSVCQFNSKQPNG